MRKIYILVITLFISVISFGQVAGDIIITEIMQNPLYPVNDSEAEYFEVYNTTAADIDMNGWTLTDNNSNAHTIASSLVVPTGGYAVLGVNADISINGGVTVDYVYGSDMALANGADQIILTTGGSVEIDRVEWDNGATFPDPNGASMNLDSALFDGASNDTGTNWCESTTALGATQFGTPGAANETCAAPCLLNFGAFDTTCDAITAGEDTYTATIVFTGGGSETYVINADSGTVSGDDPSAVADGTITITGIAEGTDLVVNVAGGTCDLTANIDSPVCVPATCMPVGSVILTEIMQNPLTPINDSEAEWFELYNTTGSDIELEGWSIIDDNYPNEGFVIPSSLIIPANDYLLFANNADPTLNGGISPDYVYDPSLTLGNGLDGLTIQCLGSIIDIVVWDGGTTFPDPNGASMSLDIAQLNATANDDGANWSIVTFTFGPTGQFGTPGGANDTQLSVLPNEIKGFSMYPNPIIDNSLHITTLSSLSKEITLFTILGEMVYQNEFTGQKNDINLNLSKGIYIIKVQEGANLSTRKLIIK